MTILSFTQDKTKMQQLWFVFVILIYQQKELPPSILVPNPERNYQFEINDFDFKEFL